MSNVTQDQHGVSESLSILAPAKVNWFLEVLGKRGDGYHEIITFMVAVELCDRLTVSRAGEDTISLEVTWTPLLGPEAGTEKVLDVSSDNVVWRAAKLLQEQTGCRYGCKLTLEKGIPVAAGLGGGSSDAAATLILLNDYWRLRLSQNELASLASHLGSDVTFFLNGPAAWCGGRGEAVSPWPMLRVYWVVLVVPPWPVSTARVYAHVQLPVLARATDDFCHALVQGDVGRLRQAMFNRLEEAALVAYPQLYQVRLLLHKVGLEHTILSGSGGTYFALFAARAEAEQAAARLMAAAGESDLNEVQVYVVPTLSATAMQNLHMRHVQAES